MKKTTLFKGAFAAMALASLAMTSCTDDTTNESGWSVYKGPTGTGYEQYVIATSPASGSYDILLYTDDLSANNLTALGSGVQTGLSGAQWYFHNTDRVFGLKYSDGDPAPMETYVMGTAKVERGVRYESFRFTTYGSWGEYMVTSASNSDTSKSTGIKEPYYNTEVYPRNMQVAMYKGSDGSSSTYDFVSDNYLGTGEYASMCGFAESGGYLYAAVYPMGVTGYGSVTSSASLAVESNSYYSDSDKYKEYTASGWGGSNSASFKPGETPTTPFPDQFHVAIFQSPSTFPQNPSVKIKDNRMSPSCGRKKSAQYPTIGAAEDGYVYIFSPGNERAYAGSPYTLYSNVLKTDGSVDDDGNTTVDYRLFEADGTTPKTIERAVGTHKASVMRIKGGETTLDESYGVFDVETAMGGRSFLMCWYITGSQSKFLVQAYNDANVIYNSSASVYKFYIVDASTKSATEVTSMPASTTISAVSRNPYFEGGKAYIGVTSSDNSYPAIYEIDAASGDADKISEVKCYSIYGIGKMIN